MSDVWEYMSTIVYAHIDNPGFREYVKETWSNKIEIKKFDPKAMIPTLNDFGKYGWELMHIQPVAIGNNNDMKIFTGGGDYFSNAYFCVFKRRLND